MALFVLIQLCFLCIGLAKSHDYYNSPPPPGPYKGGSAGGFRGPPPPRPGGYAPPPNGMGPGGRGQCSGGGCGGGCNGGSCGGCSGGSCGGCSGGSCGDQDIGSQQNQVSPPVPSSQVTASTISQGQILPTRLPSIVTTVSPVTLPVVPVPSVPPSVNASLLLPGGSASLLPPVAIPDGSLILPNGNVQFPNATILLSKYIPGTELPVARLPSGTLMFPNNMTKAAGTITTFPAPGCPLNATSEATKYPPVLLPNLTIVYRNGSIVTPGMKMLPTIF